MKRWSIVLFACFVALALAGAVWVNASRTTYAQDAAQPASPDPFVALLTGVDLSGQGALVPARALAVIPERHIGRLVRMTDVLVAIDPQFDDIARGMGLTGQRAVQLRTREANVPIFVSKTQATIATLLQVAIGASIEVQGVLVERGGRYVLLASSVRQTASRPAR